MKTGPDRKVVFALLVIAALCMIGLGASLYRAKAAHVGQMQRELREKRTELAELHDKLARQPDLESQFAKLQARLSVLEPALPDSAYIPTFLDQIEKLARQTRNRIVMIRPKQQANDARKKALAINEESGEPSNNAGPAPKKAKAGSGTADEEKPKLPYDHVDIEVKVQGSYWTVIDFLAKLQRFPKMIAVNDIAFTPERVGASAQRTPANLTASLALTAVVTKGEKNDASR